MQLNLDKKTLRNINFISFCFFIFSFILCVITVIITLIHDQNRYGFYLAENDLSSILPSCIFLFFMNFIVIVVLIAFFVNYKKFQTKLNLYLTIGVILITSCLFLFSLIGMLNQPHLQESAHYITFLYQANDNFSSFGLALLSIGIIVPTAAFAFTTVGLIKFYYQNIAKQNYNI